MQSEQLVKLVDHVYVTWNMSTNPQTKVAAYEAWERYVGDLDYDDVMRAIDREALASPWAPKPAQLRTAILHADLPSPEEAWSQCRRVLEYINYGISDGQNVIPHEVVSLTIDAIKNSVNERNFKAEYEVQKGQWLLDQFERTGE